MMSDPAGINPYAPSNVVDERTGVRDPRAAAPAISSIWLGVLTMGSVSLSGALFALATVLVLGLANEGFISLGVDLLFVAGISLIYGFILALIASIVTVPLVVFLFALGRREDWRPARIRAVALVSGGVSGFLPLCAISRFEPELISLSVVPAAFGALGTVALMEPVARRVRRTQQRLLAEALEDSAPPIREPTQATEFIG